MPRIFDNIELDLLSTLRQTIKASYRGDFCVGYFNLRGWKNIADHIENWTGGKDRCCRVLLGMQQSVPAKLIQEAWTTKGKSVMVDNKTALERKNKLANDFKKQLTIGYPSDEDEAALKELARQIRNKKVFVKLFLRHRLHAKLYLLLRHDINNPMTGFLGSSNLTMSGLEKQGELNIDVLDGDACQKLSDWFNARWDDDKCVDISEELVNIIENSWAGEQPLPYYIYLKMAYHLSEEARQGLADFELPKEFQNELFEFQEAAVKVAAHHLNKRNGVLIGDVVGLGKTLMATALARIFEDDYNLETLVICPKNLTEMWEDYCHRYRLRSRVISITRVINDLPEMRRHRLVIIDESHNLRNREGKRYRAIREYIQANASKCILLTATPYNKSYLDLSSQLRLFIPEDEDIGIRPECLIREIGEADFTSRYQCSPRSLAAFERSENYDDWRELMRLFLVRRTRTFIKDNYAHTEPETARKYLTFKDGTQSYFPERIPKTADFDVSRQYSQLYDKGVVDRINKLHLPRYGLGKHVDDTVSAEPSADENNVIGDLSKAGPRLKGFCRTNLFKRLESSGSAFIQSVERHILRNYVFIYALQNNLPVPIGTQDVQMLDPGEYDGDVDDPEVSGSVFESEDVEEASDQAYTCSMGLRTHDDFAQQAESVYRSYSNEYKKRFRWIRSEFFFPELSEELHSDASSLMKVLQKCGDWEPREDAKLDALYRLISETHPHDKVLVFSQFADTVEYLEKHLQARGVEKLKGVTGDSPNPTEIAWRFCPESNNKRDNVAPEDELRVVISTDVLSEGQNLQDCAIVVNYDLPWAIIRLVQRAGRVDRIGQKAENISCYSFMPADGVEKILNLRNRVRLRLQENAEVVGADEAFFEDDKNDRRVVDLYNEKSGVLDDDPDSEVDLASYALEIWRTASENNPKLKNIIPKLQDVVYSTKPVDEYGPGEGALVFMRTNRGTNALAWMDKEGHSYSESQFQILKAARCTPDTPPVERLDQHHKLVQKAVEYVHREEQNVGGHFGSTSTTRCRTYQRLKEYMAELEEESPLFPYGDLERTLDEIYKFPLRQNAAKTLKRQLRSGIDNTDLAKLIVSMREENKLCVIEEKEKEEKEPPQIICSLGLSRKNV